MASFRNLLGLPVKLWDNRASGQVLQLSSDKEHWEFVAGGGGSGGISDAPSDGSIYGRKNGGWIVVPSGGSGSGHIVGNGLVLDTTTNIVRVAQAGDVQITTASPLVRSQGVAGTYQMQGSGGQVPYTWSVDAGTPLPTGMTMDASGKITDAGSAANGDTACTFTVTDNAGTNVSKSITVRVKSLTVARWWRLYINAANGPTYVQVIEAQFRATSGGATLCTGGTAFASSAYSGQPAAGAFDGFVDDTEAHRWTSAGASPPVPQFVGYQLPTASVVVEVTVVGDSPTPVPAQSINGFIVQSSIDSTTGLDGTWVDEWSVTGQTGWAPGEMRTFTRP